MCEGRKERWREEMEGGGDSCLAHQQARTAVSCAAVLGPGACMLTERSAEVRGHCEDLTCLLTARLLHLET